MKTAVALFALVLPFIAGCGSSEQEYFKPDPATAGRITGKVAFRGTPPASKPVNMDQDPDCVRLHSAAVANESVIVNGGGALANVFIYVKHGVEGKRFEPPSDAVTIDQRGCWFRPRVLGIRTGQKLRVINSDPVSHNIHPLANVNRDWNQNQSPGAAPLERRFARSEIMIPVKCNIHAWMRAWIGVIDHPYFAVTAAAGWYDISGLPPGTYTLEAWHETLGTLQQTVTLPRSGSISVPFTFAAR